MIRTIRGKHVVLGFDGSRRHAIHAGVSAADSYRCLPAVVECMTRRLLHVHEVGVLSIWLLQEYNLHRDPETVDILIDIALDCVGRLGRLCAAGDTQLCLVGELSTFDQIRPGSLEHLSLQSTSRDTDPGILSLASRRIYLMLGYNYDKEFVRAMQRCKGAGIEAPSMSDLSRRWCIPTVDVLIRTGQPPGMVNMSAYWPGLERGRIISTPLYPQQLTDNEIDRLIRLYTDGVDSSSSMIDSSHH